MTTTVNWKNTRKGRKVAIGTCTVVGTPVEWFITKSAGGLSYELHFGEVKVVPMVTRATIIDCKLYAENYL